MKLSPRREPSIIASGLVSVAARPVAAFASSNNRLCIHNKGGRRLWSGHLQLCHLAKMVSKPCPEPSACGLQWSYHLAYTNGSAVKKSLGSPLLDSPAPWGLCWIKVTSFPSNGQGNCNPLQCSCLENPTDRGAWWVHRSQRVRHDWVTKHTHPYSNIQRISARWWVTSDHKCICHSERQMHKYWPKS